MFLMVYGATAVAVAVVLTAMAAAIFQNGLLSDGFRRFVGGETASVILASFLGTGGVMLILFLAGFKSQTLVALQVILAAVIVAVSFVIAVLIARRARLAETPDHAPHC